MSTVTAVAGSQVAGHRRRRRPVDVGHHHPRAFRCESSCCRGPDPGSGPGDQDDCPEESGAVRAGAALGPSSPRSHGVTGHEDPHRRRPTIRPQVIRDRGELYCPAARRGFGAERGPPVAFPSAVVPHRLPGTSAPSFRRRPRPGGIRRSSRRRRSPRDRARCQQADRHSRGSRRPGRVRCHRPRTASTLGWLTVNRGRHVESDLDDVADRPRPRRRARTIARRVRVLARSDVDRFAVHAAR